jgi:hypothetical protein
VNRIHDMTLPRSDTNRKEALVCRVVTHAAAPAEIHCIVSTLRYADERHTAPSPLRRYGWPAPSGSGCRGSEARPLHKDRAD